MRSQRIACQQYFLAIKIQPKSFSQEIHILNYSTNNHKLYKRGKNKYLLPTNSGNVLLIYASRCSWSSRSGGSVRKYRVLFRRDGVAAGLSQIFCWGSDFVCKNVWNFSKIYFQGNVKRILGILGLFYWKLFEEKIFIFLFDFSRKYFLDEKIIHERKLCLGLVAWTSTEMPEACHRRLHIF